MLNILTTKKKQILEKTRLRRKLKERGIDAHPISHEHVGGNNNHGSNEGWAVQHA